MELRIVTMSGGLIHDIKAVVVPGRNTKTRLGKFKAPVQELFEYMIQQKKDFPEGKVFLEIYEG